MDQLTDNTTFADLALRPELVEALANLGYEEPTPIQRESIPPLIAGQDLLGQAATGTGKTAAFALPMLQTLDPDNRSKNPTGLILVPTRELAMQVSEAVHKYGRALGARVLPIYGGQPIGRQLQALGRGVDVVVATPGRAVDHIKRGTIPLKDIEMVVLDEADEMLDMGFAEDLDAILGALPETRQTVLFSATMPKRIESLARRHLTNPTTIRIEAPVVAKGDAPLVRQLAFIVPRSHKSAALGRILDVESPTAAIVFCRTRHEVDQLTETLNGRGYRAEALHGGMNQEGRDRVMARVRSGNADLLIATDVAARGLDIDHLTHVVNYDVPSAPESYVHRIGRVGRAGREGVAITLAEPREHRLLENIQRVTGDKIAIEKVPTISDLRNRRMELTLGTLRETLLDDDLDRYRSIVESLTDEFDLFDVALAAVKLTHESTTGKEDEVEIPEVEIRRSKDRKNDRPDRDGRSSRSERGERGDYEKKGKKGKDRSIGVDSTRLYFPIGRSSQIRPGDLVGAITGETGLAGKQIGSIEIGDKFSLVEVPEKSADDIIKAMKKTTIKGRKVVPRRERFERFER
ncbi:MAG: DEAD/DEAH box helicase [Actinomycetota bacterium]